MKWTLWFIGKTNFVLYVFYLISLFLIVNYTLHTSHPVIGCFAILPVLIYIKLFLRVNVNKLLVEVFYRKIESKPINVQSVKYMLLYGTQRAWSTLYHKSVCEDSNSFETILASAIRHPSGLIFQVPRPGRHHHVIWGMGELGVNGKSCKYTDDQGFLTSKFRYVDRVEAFEIAAYANQIIKKTGNTSIPELYSEDVWVESILPEGTQATSDFVLTGIPKFLLKDDSLEM